MHIVDFVLMKSLHFALIIMLLVFQKWDKCLCERDSDGDGMTNGEELGDPDCTWKPGDTPKVVAMNKLSHPGE